MTIKAKLAAAMFAAAAVVGAASTAEATTYNNFNGTSGTYGNDVTTPRGGFVNFFTFNLTRSGAVTSTITSSASSNATNIDFTRVRLTGPAGFTAINYTPLSTGTFEFRTLGPVDLLAGVYTLEVRGRSGGQGSYAGDFTLAGGVPEPAAWAMMIGGFGMAGGALRRRRVSTTVRFA